jgi:serine/threonine protein kinase
MKFIHLRGCLHRDLKPENIVLDEHGLAQVADVGNSRLSDLTLHRKSFAQITTPGPLMSTRLH